MKRTNNKGFTLTEILIVLVVAGILLALILPNTLKAIQRADVAELRSDLNSIKVGALMCFTETRSWAAPCDTVGNLTAAAANYLDAGIVTNPPFGVNYGLTAIAGGSGLTACYKGGTPPVDVTNDSALAVCP